MADNPETTASGNTPTKRSKPDSPEELETSTEETNKRQKSAADNETNKPEESREPKGGEEGKKPPAAEGARIKSLDVPTNVSEVDSNSTNKQENEAQKTAQVPAGAPGNPAVESAKEAQKERKEEEGEEQTRIAEEEGAQLKNGSQPGSGAIDASGVPAATATVPHDATHGAQATGGYAMGGYPEASYQYPTLMPSHIPPASGAHSSPPATSTNSSGIPSSSSSSSAHTSSATTSIPLPESLSPDPPSKVIHFRNVIAELSQQDIMSICTPFGDVDKVVMMRTKNQALIEFKELAHAIMMINFYIHAPPQVRGRKVYVRFSRHQQLTSSNSTVNKILLATLHADYSIPFPITADVVWQIFSPYGFIEKIVVINKGNGLQSLVQYNSNQAATTAMQYLNGKTVYIGTDPILAVTLYIQYSNLDDLTVKANTPESRNYIQPLPWGGSPHSTFSHTIPYGAPGVSMPGGAPGMGAGMTPMPGQYPPTNPADHGGGYE